MPVHDVGPYVHRALESVLEQSFSDLEVVVVDDGSTDDSATIVKAIAESDQRVRVVRQDNAGLGAARNVGVRHARGAFLAFADGDDVVPPGSYEAMVSTLVTTGSDMVVGTLERLGGETRRMGRLMRENHARRREAVTLVQMPQMLADVFAVNKVFRRTFWDDAGLQFPEDTRYEDQPTMTRAFLAADRFDVLAQTVYRWRRRRDRSSITQNRHRIEDLRDRVETKRTATRAVMEAHPELKDLWYGTILPVDLWAYFEAATRCSDEYWQLLREATRELWNDSTVPFTATRVPVHQRLMGWLVVDDRRADLRRLIDALDAGDRVMAFAIRGDAVVWQVPGIDTGPLPESTWTLGPHELEWEARILEATWDGDGVLTVRGFALAENVPTGGRSTALTASLRGPAGRCQELEVRTRPEPRATLRMGRAGQDFDDCGFELSIDLRELVRRYPCETAATAVWRLRLDRTVESLRVGGGVTSYRTAAVDRRWHPVNPGVEARLRDAKGSLVLDVRDRVGGTQSA
jgi:CDP-glycerol glycerophosphotransferase